MMNYKSMPKRSVKRGRRPGASTAAEEIRAHAASAFSQSGFDGTTIREIATRAGVDPALIFHYFKSKRALFEASIDVPDLATVPALDVTRRAPSGSTPDATLGERIVHDFLSTWDAPSARATIGGLLRSASSNAQAMRSLAEVVQRTVVIPTIASIDAKRGMPKLRAALVATQLVGVAWTRYVLATEPIASASPAILARTLGPSIEMTLRGTDYGRRG